MHKYHKLITFVLLSAMMSGCGSNVQNNETPVTTMDTVVSESITEPVEPGEEIAEEPPEERVTDEIICNWMYKSLTDSEEFTDISNYQYYARTLGLEKNYFLDPQLWEVYYNPDLNINNEINGKEIYLIRLNPYQLLNIYAERNNCTVDELCSALSATKEQLYYNWGYNPAWINYDKNHADLKVFASDKEISIFGASNSEDRAAVMRTHTLTVDTLDKNICSYSSAVDSRLKIRRMDLLGSVSGEKQFYSEYTEQEKNAAFTVNGIGIRAVIPLSINNAWENAAENEKSITPFINVSPYAYGCTDAHKIEIIDYSKIAEEE